MSKQETKIFLMKEGEEIELISYNEDDFKIQHPTLDDYNDFVININGEKFNIKALKSDWDRLKSLLEE